MVLRLFTNPTVVKILAILLTQFVVLCLLIQFDVKVTHEGISATRDLPGRSFPRHRLIRLDTMRAQSQPPVHKITNISSIVKQRTKAVREYCSNHKTSMIAEYPDYSKSYGLLNWVWMRSKIHRLFYCATPKCGSTTWKSYLMEDSNISWTIDTHE